MPPKYPMDKGLVMIAVRAFRSMRKASVLCAGTFAMLAGCRKVPQAEQTLPVARTTVKAAEAPQESKPGGEDCGLSAYPVSKSNQQILADARREDKRSPNSTMLAKVAIDEDGRVTHLKILRIAYPEIPNSEGINEQAVDSIKRWHYAPTMFGGKPVAVCTDVTVIIDFGSN